MPLVHFKEYKKYYLDGIMKIQEAAPGDVAELPDHLAEAFIEQKICEPAELVGETDEDTDSDIDDSGDESGPTLTKGAQELLKKYPDIDLTDISQKRVDKSELEKYIEANELLPVEEED